MRVLLSVFISAFALAIPVRGEPVDFHTQVAPILVQHCYECHGGDESKGGFSINTRGLMLDADAAEPGNADASYMIELILEEDPAFIMPPQGKPRLTAEQVATLKAWINEGMQWEAGFTFAKARYEPPLEPRRPDLPDAVGDRTNPVDRIIDAYLAEQDLAPTPPVDDAVFYRRVSLDLVGLLPGPADVERFVADADPDKHAKLVDQLLAEDVEYARHWMTFWNDLLRNDYQGTGYITGGRKSISNWLYRSLLENKPYDQFTRELLAPTGGSEGFINGIKWRGDVNSSQSVEIQFAQNVGQVFLGINIKCASCHDSFIDRWTLEEAYSLAAVFADQPLEMNRCDKPTGEIAQPAWLFPELGQVDPAAPRNQRLQQLAQLMTSPGNGRLNRTIVNRLWHRMMGRGIVEPVDAMQTEPWSEDLLDYLAVYLGDEGYDLKAVMRLITTSRAYRAQSLVQDEQAESASFVFAGPIIKRMTAEQFVDAIRQVTQTQTTGVDKKFAARRIEQELGLQTPHNISRASMLASDFLQRAMGRPNREQVVTSRPQMLTTLEALDLANGEAMNEKIKAGAAKLLELHGDKSADDLIDLVFTRSLSRVPDPAERAVCRSMLGQRLTATGVEDLLWSVFMLPEFQYVR
ncbi:MAG: PSD1 and planctomycete cytochrome C domain-containing protein [Planctomycetota bacterium]